MKEKEVSNLTDEELLEAAKKITPLPPVCNWWPQQRAANKLKKNNCLLVISFPFTPLTYSVRH